VVGVRATVTAGPVRDLTVTDVSVALSSVARMRVGGVGGVWAEAVTAASTAPNANAVRNCLRMVVLVHDLREPPGRALRRRNANHERERWLWDGVAAFTTDSGSACLPAYG